MKKTIALLAMLATLCAAQSAMAEITGCAEDAAPIPYGGEYCRPLAARFGAPVCSHSSWDTVTCDLAVNGDNVGGHLRAIVGWPGASGTYQVWGEDGAGNRFCCDISSVADEFEFLGTSQRDTIFLHYGSFNFELDGPAVWDVSVYGNDGDDHIEGSNHAHLSYIEGHHGGLGDDTIYGGDGREEIWGDEGNDVLHGDGWVNWIHGGDGNDVLVGGPDQDWMYGDAGQDNLSGHAGDDWLWGGSGGDVIHGGTDDDIIRGETGSDWLHGDGGNDLLCDVATASNYFNGGSGHDILFSSFVTMPVSHPYSTSTGGPGIDACGSAFLFSFDSCEAEVFITPYYCK